MESGKHLNLSKNRHLSCSINTHIPTGKIHVFVRYQQETPLLYSVTCTSNLPNCIQFCWLPFQTYYTDQEW